MSVHFFKRVDPLASLPREFEKKNREISTLYKIIDISETEGLGLEQIIAKLHAVIPEGFQYPEAVCTRITIKGVQYPSDGFLKTDWKISEPFFIGSGQGSVDVFYKEHKPVADEGPFFKEERRLLHAVAKRLGRIIGRIYLYNSLTESELYFRGVTENALAGVFILNESNMLVYTNAAAEKIFGYEHDELTNKDPMILIEPNDIPLVKSLLAKRTTGRDEFSQFECRGIRKDRSVLHIEMMGSQYTVNGQNLIFGNVLDVTERIQNQQAIKDSESRFRLMVENITDVVIIADQDSKILYRSPSNSTTEYTPDEVLGKRFIDFVIPDEQPAFQRFLKRIIDGGSGYVEEEEFRVLSQTGDKRILLIIGKNLIDDTLINGILFTHYNVTEVKQAQDALLEETERYHTLVESTQNLVWIADPDDFKLLLFNSALAQFHEQFLGIVSQQCMPVGDMFPNDLPFWIACYEKAKREGHYKVKYDTPYGQKLYISFSALYVNGKNIGISVFAEDITEKENYQQELEVTNQKLSDMFDKAIGVISKMGEIRDRYTAGHQKKVRLLACAITKAMGMSPDTINNISLAALVHDIGKMYIASDILNKPDIISELEFEIIKTHVNYSYEIVKDFDFPWQIPAMVYQHHERLDGSGYPEGISGEQIIPESRILAVADVVDAISSDRPYRPALGVDTAIREILKFSGTKYDSKVVDTCIQVLYQNPNEFYGRPNTEYRS